MDRNVILKKKYLSIQQICTSLTFQSVAKAAFSCLQSIKVTFLILHHFPRCCSPVVLFPVVTPRCGYSHGSPGRTSSRHDNGVCSPPLRCVPRCGPGPGLIFAVVSSPLCPQTESTGPQRETQRGNKSEIVTYIVTF